MLAREGEKEIQGEVGERKEGSVSPGGTREEGMKKDALGHTPKNQKRNKKKAKKRQT